MVPWTSSPTFCRNTRERSPRTALPGLNANEYPSRAQVRPTNPKADTLIIKVLSAFLDLTSPP